MSPLAGVLRLAVENIFVFYNHVCAHPSAVVVLPCVEDPGHVAFSKNGVSRQIWTLTQALFSLVCDDVQQMLELPLSRAKAHDTDLDIRVFSSRILYLLESEELLLLRVLCCYGRPSDRQSDFILGHTRPNGFHTQ